MKNKPSAQRGFDKRNSDSKGYYLLESEEDIKRENHLLFGRKIPTLGDKK